MPLLSKYGAHTNYRGGRTWSQLSISLAYFCPKKLNSHLASLEKQGLEVAVFGWGDVCSTILSDDISFHVNVNSGLDIQWTGFCVWESWFRTEVLSPPLPWAELRPSPWEPSDAHVGDLQAASAMGVSPSNLMGTGLPIISLKKAPPELTATTGTGTHHLLAGSPWHRLVLAEQSAGSNTDAAELGASHWTSPAPSKGLSRVPHTQSLKGPREWGKGEICDSEKTWVPSLTDAESKAVALPWAGRHVSPSESRLQTKHKTGLPPEHAGILRTLGRHGFGYKPLSNPSQ